MLHNDDILDSYEKDIRPFYESENFKCQHVTNNRKIEAFRTTLSLEQRKEFTKLLNSLSNEYSDVALEAYACGYKNSTKR